MSDLGSFVKRLRDIMRNDAGINGDAQRIEQIAWMLFLKVYDAQEENWEFDEEDYVSIIPEDCRWRNWAVDDGKGTALTGDQLLEFVNNTLFPTLKGLDVDADTPIKKAVVKSTFEDANQYMKDGVLLRQVINIIDSVDFGDYEESHAFGDIYEAILKEQRELEEFQAGLYWKRLGDALKAAGVDFWWLQDNIKRHDFDRSGKFNRQLCSYRLSPETIEALLDGKPADNDEAEIPTPFIWEQDVLAAQSLAKMADLLDVSIDYLMLRTDDPNPCPDPDTAAAGWSTGDPPAEGRYLCTVDLGNKPAEQKCDWKAGQWTAYGRPVDDVFKVIAWYPLPDGPYYPREHWDEVAEEEEDDDDD